MHVHFLDPFRPGQSFIHQLDPRVKLVLTLAFILTTSLTPMGAWAAYLLLLALALSVELLSELGVAYVLKRAFIAIPFALAALPLIFTVQGAPRTTFGFGTWSVTMTAPGVERFLSIAFKSWVSVQLAVVLAATTPFPQLLMAMRAIHIPRLFVAMFGLMWRYLFVLADEALRLMRAREARSGATGDGVQKVGGTLAWRARVTGGMAGNLFMRSFERGERIYAAMAARGYDGEIRSFPLSPLVGTQWLFLIGGGGILILILALSLILIR